MKKLRKCYELSTKDGKVHLESSKVGEIIDKIMRILIDSPNIDTELLIRRMDGEEETPFVGKPNILLTNTRGLQDLIAGKAASQEAPFAPEMLKALRG